MIVQKPPKPIQNTKWLHHCFKDQDAFIVAGGPSLNGFDFKRLENKKVIAVNHSYMYVKCDILVALDARFFFEAKQRDPAFIENAKFKIIAGPSSGQRNSEKILVIYYSSEPTLRDAGSLYCQSSSTLIAINAALFTGAKRIFLLGLDGKFSKGLGHFYSDKWKHHADNEEIKYKRNVHKYLMFKKFKNIFNCNRESAIKAFPYMDINTVL